MTSSAALRSWLFAPGDRPDRFAKALRSGADVVILDLEDAVAADQKPEARRAVLSFLRRRPPGGARIAVRINPFASRLGLTDLDALIESATPPDFIVLPKVEGAATPGLVGEILDDVGAATRLVALIETPRGLAAAAEAAQATPRLDALMFGAADYAAALGRTASELRPDPARAAIANAAAIAGLLAIDTPFFALNEAEALNADCADSYAAGFCAKAAIHPAQIAIINSAFTPSAESCEVARRILAATNGAAARLDGRMVDVAMRRWASRTLGAAGLAL